MLIDPLSTQFSGQTQAISLSAPSSVTVINNLKTALLAAGWTGNGQYYATTTVTFPFGMPTTPGVAGPIIPVTCSGNEFTSGGFVTMRLIGSTTTINFNFYDPYTESPTLGPCIWFALATDPFSTLLNLAMVITAKTPFTAVASTSGPNYILTLTATNPGPAYNLYQWGGNGAWVEGFSYTQGGGWGFDSVATQQTYSYHLDLTAAFYPVTGGSLISFAFTIGAKTVTFPLTGGDQSGEGDEIENVDQYTIVVNPYGGCIFDDSDDTLDAQWRHTSMLWAGLYVPAGETTPSVPPTEQFYLTPAVLVIGPNQRNLMGQFQGGAMYLTSGDWLSFTNTDYARILALRSAYANTLYTPDAQPIIICAYAMIYSAGNPPNVPGKIWDASVTSQLLTGGALTIQKKQYYAFAWSSGGSHATIATLLVCAGTGPPANAKSGTVNVFGYGVTWVSGATFTPDMAGGSITIDGIQYTVASVTDSTHLVLLHPPTYFPAPGVSYTVP